MVNGRVLASLTEGDLEAVGVGHALHRRAIIFAVEELAAAAGGDAARAAAAAADTGAGGHGGMGGMGGSGSGALSAAESAMLSGRDPAYDVFISYRRAGGADFAHLIKLQLQAAGLRVFLDVENIGTGDFAEVLDRSMRAARNVVLVWSKGCMDRFLDDGDAASADFVRREYAYALRLRKHIVPVYKEDFVFPVKESLPEDVRGVMDKNAIKFVAEYREASFAKLKAALLMV